MIGIVVLCEGRHDVAYISLLLENDGYLHYKETVSQMVSPLYEYFSSKISSFPYDSNLLFKRPILPWIMYKQEGQSKNAFYVLLYSMDGLDKPENYNEIIDDFGFQAQPEEDLAQEMLFQDSKLALVFILDADNNGIESRVDLIKERYSENLPVEMNLLGHGEDCIVETQKSIFKAIGCYVLSKEGEEFGNLEDIILPLMKKGNQSIFDEAEKFLSDNEFERKKKQKKVWVIDKTKTEGDFKKSTIGVAGQLDCTGEDNMYIIQNSRFLKGKINGDPKSDDITKFFRKLRALIRKSRVGKGDFHP